MAIARGLTRRYKQRPEEPTSPPPARAQSVKRDPGQPIDRAKISMPVALISTTNMLSYNAPDITSLRTGTSSPSTASTHSAEDSDVSSPRSRSSSHVSRDTLTDASSVGSSPTSPAPNHLSDYFDAANKAEAAKKTMRRSASSGNLHQKTQSIEAPPAIPQRALSHSKRAHERLAHKRSLQNLSRGSLHSNRSSREHRTSVDMFRAPIEEEGHPFGKELEQLNEVAEEFGGVVRDAEMEADYNALRDKNLAAYCAADYMLEIKPLFRHRFENPYLAAPMAWI